MIEVMASHDIKGNKFIISKSSLLRPERLHAADHVARDGPSLRPPRPVHRRGHHRGRAVRRCHRGRAGAQVRPAHVRSASARWGGRRTGGGRRPGRLTRTRTAPAKPPGDSPRCLRRASTGHTVPAMAHQIRGGGSVLDGAEEGRRRRVQGVQAGAGAPRAKLPGAGGLRCPTLGPRPIRRDTLPPDGDRLTLTSSEATTLGERRLPRYFLPCSSFSLKQTTNQSPEPDWVSEPVVPGTPEHEKVSTTPSLSIFRTL